jgi:DNA modification methylase
MQTFHKIYAQDSRSMHSLAAGGAELVLTSPPYPMIAMWDDLFRSQDEAIGRALDRGDGRAAFERMHRALDPVWGEVHRILAPGGFACINIGDATRSIGGGFMLYPNHVRVLSQLLELGFTPLPAILWRKQTNSPNKFMGSGMLPAGAYVTLEHEYILIARKGDKREFATPQQKQARRESALFWEERNSWFSDVWLELKGVRQDRGTDARNARRSGAYPFELAYRLISMFSVKGDTVVDPFAGTGTTLKAAAAAARNSIGFEIDPSLLEGVFSDADDWPLIADRRIAARIAAHLDFVRQCRETGRALAHVNRHYGFPVVTRQETDLLLNRLESTARSDPRELVATLSDDAPATGGNSYWARHSARGSC